MKSDRQDATGVQLGVSEALVRTEIGFWRDLIESCQDTDPPERIERMRFALALAEAKLSECTSNVYLLDEANE